MATTINGQTKRTLKKFGIISSIIFSVIIILSVMWIHLTNFSNLSVIQTINIIILSSGVIGLGYCILILRTFDNKTNDLVKDYDKIVKDLDNK